MYPCAETKSREVSEFGNIFFGGRLLTALAVERPEVGAGEPPGTDGMDSRSFGRRMRQLRFAKGLTQKACAERADVSQGRWSEWEAGDAEPGVTTIPIIAEALGVPVETSA